MQNDHRQPVSTLCPADTALLDQLIDARAAGVDVAAPDALIWTNHDPVRAQQLQQLASLLNAYPVTDAPADLAERTLLRLAENKQRLQLDQQIDRLHQHRNESVSVLARLGRWVEIGAAAAMILIGVSLMFPVLDNNQATIRQAGCLNNLGRAGMAFGGYANDHNDKLPRRTDQPKGLWIRVGQPQQDSQEVQSNTAHYVLLVNKGYCQVSTLACPENEHAPSQLAAGMIDFPSPQAPSFSYQNQHTAFELRLHNATMGILADRNPMFRVQDGRLVQDPDVSANSNSRLHNQRGQNVLLNNLAVRWYEQPVLSKEKLSTHQQKTDHIWAIYKVSQYRGDESPRDPNDTHLVP